jgi:hypothetical protein
MERKRKNEARYKRPERTIEHKKKNKINAETVFAYHFHHIFSFLGGTHPRNTQLQLHYAKIPRQPDVQFPRSS